MSYVYRHVTVEQVIDGDTVRLAIDLGNHSWWVDSFRLNGIDTPERGQIGYVEAKVQLINLLAGGVSRIETHKPDKYGRWLVDIYAQVDPSGELHVNRALVVDGFAKEYRGGKKE